MSKPTSVTARVCACPAALLESPAAELLVVDEDADDEDAEDGDDDVEDDDAASLLPPQAVSSPRAKARPPAAATRRTWNTDTGTSRWAGGRRPRRQRPAHRDPAMFKEIREACVPVRTV